ncbi:MAG: hypothetical protein K8T20_19960 [Planctomycetes bacterium]|nr:hypothetical protein [Planctomycetota bacterium]
MLAVLFALEAVADKLTMKDGRVFEGRVISENDREIKIRTARATLTVPRDQVERIDKGTSTLQQRDEKLEALTLEKPEEYIDVASWLLGEGASVWDSDLFRRLCAIPVAQDPRLAVRANLVLGRGWEAHGRPEEAAEAWARAEAADPADPEARRLAASGRKTLESAARRRVEALRNALRAASNENFAEAVPVLRNSQGGPGATEAEASLGRSLDAMTTDLQRRIRCKPCEGTAQIECPLCKGTGALQCADCGGTGARSSFTTGREAKGTERKLCRACLGMGNALCTNCKAERDVIFNPAISMDLNGKKTVMGIRIHTTAGHEFDEIRKEINLRDLTTQTGGTDVTSVLVEKVNPGGKRNCPSCGGVKFDPPAQEVDFKALSAATGALDAKLTSGGSFLRDLQPQSRYDEKVIADRFWLYSNGRWVFSK